MWSKGNFRAIPEIAEKPQMPVCQGVRAFWLWQVGWMPIRSQTGIENFFRTFLTVFYRFRSYSVTLVTSYKPPFPPVPRASVVIHVVKNASRQKRQEAFLHSSAGLSKEILFHIRDAAILIAEPFIIRETISAVSNHIEPAG